jgi:hypothetical protein
MNKVLREWFVFGGAVLAIAVGVFGIPWGLMEFSKWSSRREHAAEIDVMYRDRVLPAAAFVRDFVAREQRLPNDHEMETYNRETAGHGWVTIHRERPPWIEAWGVPGRDFIVRSGIEEWNVFYCSWDARQFEVWTD